MDNKPMNVYIMASHNRIETNPNKSAHLLVKDEDYDLIIASENRIVQTVKGRTIVKNVTEGKYRVSNLIPPKYEVYMFNCSKRPPSWATIGKIDFTRKDAVVSDKGLNGIKFVGKKISRTHLAIGIQNKVIDLQWETQKYNPLGNRMGVPNEENILTVTIGNRVVDNYNLKYNGKVESVELQKKNDQYQLRLNTNCSEDGPKSSRSSIDITL